MNISWAICKAFIATLLINYNYISMTDSSHDLPNKDLRFEPIYRIKKGDEKSPKKVLEVHTHKWPMVKKKKKKKNIRKKTHSFISLQASFSHDARSCSLSMNLSASISSTLSTVFFFIFMGPRGLRGCKAKLTSYALPGTFLYTEGEVIRLTCSSTGSSKTGRGGRSIPSGSLRRIRRETLRGKGSCTLFLLMNERTRSEHNIRRKYTQKKLGALLSQTIHWRLLLHSRQGLHIWFQLSTNTEKVIH